MEELDGLQSTGHKESDTTEQLHFHKHYKGGFPGGSVVKNPPANAGDASLSLSKENPLEKETASHFNIPE